MQLDFNLRGKILALKCSVTLSKHQIVDELYSLEWVLINTLGNATWEFFFLSSLKKR